MKKKGKGTSKPEAEVRKDVRVATSQERLIEGRDVNDGPWKELTTLLNISKSGAGFTLSRPCSVGRLVKLTVPVAEELHALSETDLPYVAVGLVQYCQHSKTGQSDGNYHVGVAFVGEEFPETYFDDPDQSYRITGSGESGMWTITEARSEFVVRRSPRFGVELDVKLAAIQKDRNAPRDKEDTITYDVSLHGACVPSALNVGIGDRIKFASEKHNFYAIATVKNRSRRYGFPALHLEFLNAQYPVEKITPITVDYDGPADADPEPEA